MLMSQADFNADSPGVQEVEFLVRVGGLSPHSVSLATGASLSNVMDWVEGVRSPQAGEAERLLQLSELVSRLTRLIQPYFIAGWLTRSVPALGGGIPIQLIRRGDYRILDELLSSFEGETLS